ncbi:MAG TPA: serine/threonine-protein kinase [Planctomycetota bacterium]|nr:serine/threonine-protein kinase [Planctomycetota bacterium]
MSHHSSTRLERALELFCDHQQHGGDMQELLARHPDLAEILASFVDDQAAAPGAETADRFDDFDLLREVGRGGAGTVYEARQRSLGRTVALKLLHEPFTTNPTALARFHREAQTLARLDHPGVVRVFAASAVATRPWLAMEFVDGESLAAHLEHLRATGHRGDSLRQLVAAMAQVAAALHHAHAMGIVHRDVKPSNILMRSNGAVVLTDFGLAHDASAPSLTRTGVAAGTPHYMAPEQVLGGGERCDARTDVFALGATLYECVTLRRAFDGTNTQEVLQAILARDPSDVRRLVPGLPADLAAIVHKAIEKAPDRRYATAGEFGDDLRAFLDLRPIVARPPSRTRRLLRLARRHPMVAALGLVIACGLVSGGVFAWQWPLVRAAAAAQVSEQFEDAMVLGTLARTGPDAEACYRHFRRAIELAPERDEGLAGLCFAIWHYEGPLAALQELERHGDASGPNLGRCRAVLLRRLDRVDEAKALEQGLGPPATPLALWLAAAPLIDDTSSRDELLEADRMLSLAIRTAPRPRLLLHMQWAVLQTVLDLPAQRREAAEALLRLWPDNALALYAAGTNLMTADPHRALTLLQRAVQLGASDPLARVNVGVAQIRCDQPHDAAATLAAAWPDTRLTDANRERIVGLVHTIGDDDLETRLCGEWLARAPTSLGARHCAARLATRHREHERAVALFRECVAAAPRDFDLRWELAFAMREGDDLTGAQQLLAELARERPAHERTHALLLDVADAQQAPELALAELERWAAANDADAAAWRDLAEALLETRAPGCDERALAAAEHADYLTQGRVAAVLNLRADALERLGRHDEAGRVRARAASAPAATTAR